MIPSHLHRCVAKIQRSYLSSCHHYATGSSCRRVNGGKDESNTKRIDLKIISRGNIKPADATPYHLKTYSLSIFDQLLFDYYTPRILFLPNNNKTCVSDVITIRSRRLKKSLSELLTKYYPFAGEIIDNFHIDCNDKGVYFVEARVNETLQQFLQQPDDQKMRELAPKHPFTTESSLRKHVTSIQVNIFNCGGIGLCTSMSHKIIDGSTYFTFMKAWAAATTGSSNIISPCFVASDIFPNNPLIKYSLPSKLRTTKLLCTKRFVFDSTALTSLKAKTIALGSPPTRAPTRTEVISALVWKAAAKAASSVRKFSAHSPHVMFSLVNLRKRASPPLPNKLVGNIIGQAIGISFPSKQSDLPTLMGEVKESIAKVNSDYIESLKGEKAHDTINGLLRMVNGLMDEMHEGDCLIVSSLLNSGMYNIDFGWDKPIWLYHMNPGNSRFVTLNDVIKGGGVEATVSLSWEEMEIFESDPELLSYATPSPSPLRSFN